MLFVQARNSVLRPAVTTATPHGFKFPIDFNESVETREVHAADRNGVNHEPLEAGTRAPSLLQDTPLETREFEKSPGPSKRQLTTPSLGCGRRRHRPWQCGSRSRSANPWETAAANPNRPDT